MKVVEPSVSTASRRRTSACFPAIRWAARARDSVTVGSSPSGTSATVTPTANRNPSVGRCPEQHCQREEADADPDGHHRDGPDHPVQLYRRAGSAGAVPCGSGPRSRRAWCCAPVATTTAYAGLDHDEGAGVQRRTRLGVHGHALAGQHRLVHGQLVAVHHRQVGTDPVAGFSSTRSPTTSSSAPIQVRRPSRRTGPAPAAAHRAGRWPGRRGTPARTRRPRSAAPR